MTIQTSLGRFAKAGAVDHAKKQDIAEMSEKFRASGGEVYMKE